MSHVSSALPSSRDVLEYSVRFDDRQHHVVDIELKLPSSAADRELVFAVWTPGSYLVREYSRSVESIELRATSEGVDAQVNAPSLERLAKNRWRIAPSSQPVTIAYRLTCHEMTVRTNWCDDEFALLNGAATFPRLAGADTGFRVALHLPDDWQDIACSLKREENGKSNALLAEDFDQLVDSPILVGKFPVQHFESGGAQHRLVTIGDNELWSQEQVLADVACIVEGHQHFWGEVPYEDYWFLNLAVGGRGGLEHDDSTVLMCGRDVLLDRESYVNWLGLVSHEFFHTWNVRRLRPRALMQYNYDEEHYVDGLWVAEGITSYFDDLSLLRLGLCSVEEYLTRLSKTIQVVQDAEGRMVQSLIESSRDAWLKLYRPTPTGPNSQISYYTKGALVAWLLDVHLRQSTEEEFTLDDLMRELWTKYRASGYTQQDVEALVEQHSSLEVRRWLHEVVTQATELNLQAALRYFGLRFQEKGLQSPGPGCQREQHAELGCMFDTEGTNSCFLTRVPRQSAAGRAGLNVGDEILAVDGWRVSSSTMERCLRRFEPKQEVEVVLSRRGRLLKRKVQLDASPTHRWQLEVDDHADEDAAKRRKEWLGQ